MRHASAQHRCERRLPVTRGSPLGNVTYANGTLTREACTRARATTGVQLPPLLKKAGVTAAQIQRSNVRIPVRAQVQLLNSIAEALDDDLLGFHLAQAADVRKIGMLYYVFASSPTVIEALQRSARYISLANEGIAQRCTTTRHVVVEQRYVGVSRHLDRHQAESVFALMLRIIRSVTGRQITPRQVRFAHSRLQAPRELRTFFGCKVEFGAACDVMVLSKSDCNAAIVDADPYLNDLLVEFCEQALRQRRISRRQPFSTMVENAMAPLLPHGKVRATTIARTLGVSERTLARRLHTEGQSFSSLLDRLRHSLAHRYLIEPDASVSEIAWLLGYQETSAFSRAYKRWNGHSPRAARAHVRGRRVTTS